MVLVLALVLLVLVLVLVLVRVLVEVEVEVEVVVVVVVEEVVVVLFTSHAARVSSLSVSRAYVLYGGLAAVITFVITPDLLTTAAPKGL